MRTNNFFQVVLAFFIVLFQNAQAQTNINESGNIIRKKPIDGLYESGVKNRLELGQNHIEELDVLWERRVWREIDIKELQNHHFAYEQSPLVSILIDAVNDGKLTAYSAEDDQFKKCLTTLALNSMISRVDTIMITDIDADTLKPIVIQNSFNPKSVERYRVKEIVYFDSKLSRYNTRIIGVAPIMNRYDCNGNFLASAPLCWFYFDEMRPVLAKEATFNSKTDTKNLSWVDVLDSGFFAGRITKVSNVHDRRLQDIFSGIKIIQESYDLHEDFRNIEADFTSNH